MGIGNIEVSMCHLIKLHPSRRYTNLFGDHLTIIEDFCYLLKVFNYTN